ncbi:hypothetical protein B0A55_12262 [Friedmanniomyces simplex]|uniref:Uncharacterized protein n=1 Tax=Friedmanniomyces simplex TaxID=329884 RepID=A0A4U0WKX6_9PEZI|nr:hypothetical protein B0A55_12262 [Friedmanniomyces simplex]
MASNKASLRRSSRNRAPETQGSQQVNAGRAESATPRPGAPRSKSKALRRQGMVGGEGSIDRRHVRPHKTPKPTQENGGHAATTRHQSDSRAQDESFERDPKGVLETDRDSHAPERNAPTAVEYGGEKGGEHAKHEQADQKLPTSQQQQQASSRLPASPAANKRSVKGGAKANDELLSLRHVGHHLDGASSFNATTAAVSSTPTAPGATVAGPFALDPHELARQLDVHEYRLGHFLDATPHDFFNSHDPADIDLAITADSASPVNGIPQINRQRWRRDPGGQQGRKARTVRIRRGENPAAAYGRCAMEASFEEHDEAEVRGGGRHEGLERHRAVMASLLGDEGSWMKD